MSFSTKTWTVTIERLQNGDMLINGESMRESKRKSDKDIFRRLRQIYESPPDKEVLDARCAEWEKQIRDASRDFSDESFQDGDERKRREFDELYTRMLESRLYGPIDPTKLPIKIWNEMLRGVFGDSPSFPVDSKFLDGILKVRLSNSSDTSMFVSTDIDIPEGLYVVKGTVVKVQIRDDVHVGYVSVSERMARFLDLKEGEEIDFDPNLRVGTSA